MLVNENIIRAYLDANCGSYKENNKEFLLISPFFPHDKAGKLYVSKQEGKWIDFLAAGDKQYQGRFDKLVALMEGISVGQARHKIVNLCIQHGFDIAIDDASDTIHPHIDKLPVEMPGSFIPALDHPVSMNYLKTRGVSRSMVDVYGIMYNRTRNTIVLPYIRESKTVYYVERYIDQSNAQRWRFPPVPDNIYYSKADLFFGEHTVTSVEDIVFITEGPFDSIRIAQFGFQAMAVCGAAISDRQIEFLKMNNFRRVGLALDFDAAGQQATYNIADALRAYTSTTVVFNQSQDLQRKIFELGKKDWGELTEDAFADFMAGLVPYSALSRVSLAIDAL